MLSLRRLGRCIALLLGAGLMAGMAAAQTVPNWTGYGPAGGSLTALTSDPLAPATTLYVGSDDNGVFVSLDAGATWITGNSGLTGLPTQHIYALATLGNFIYAALDSGVYVSPAGGTPVWVPLPLPNNAAPQCSDGVGGFIDGTYKSLLQLGGTLYIGSDCTSSVWGTPVAGTRPVWTSASLPEGHFVSALGQVAGDIAVGSDSALYLADRSSGSLALRDSEAGVMTGAVLSGSVTALVQASANGVFVCAGAQVYQAALASGTDPMAWSGPLAFVGAAAPASCNALALVQVALPGKWVVVLAADEGAFVTSVLDDAAPIGPLNLPNLLPGPAFPMTTGTNAAWQLSAATLSGVWWATEFGLYRSAAADLAVQPVAAPLALNGPSALATPSKRLENVNVVDVAGIGTNLYAVAQSTGRASYLDVMRSTDNGVTWLATGLVSSFPDVVRVRMLATDATRKVLYAATNAGVYGRRESDQVWVQVGNPYEVRALAVGAQALYAGRDVDPDQDAGLIIQPLLDGTSFAAITSLPSLPTGYSIRALAVSAGQVYTGGGVLGDADAGTYANAVYASADYLPPAAVPTWNVFGSGRFSGALQQRISHLALGSGQVFAGGDGFLRKCLSIGSAWSDVPGLPLNSTGELASVSGLASDGVTLYVSTAAQGLYAWTLGTTSDMVSINGSGNVALPSLAINSVRMLGDQVHVASAAGLSRPVVLPSGGGSGGDGGGGTGITGGGPTVTWNGGGGCSMANAGEPDPLLWLLVALALLQLGWGCWRRRVMSRDGAQSLTGELS